MIKIDFKPSRSQLTQFGLIALFGFPLISLVVLWRFADWEPNPVVYALWALGGYCGLLAVPAPAAVRPVYVMMMLVALPIGLVLAPLLLALVYYLLITPMALWFKVIGRDAMHRKLEPAAATYWLDHRDRTRPRTPASYFRLY